MLGEKIKLFREQKNMSLRQLAINSEVSASYLCDLESGKRNNPSMQVLQRLANALSINITEFLQTA